LILQPEGFVLKQGQESHLIGFAAFHEVLAKRCPGPGIEVRQPGQEVCALLLRCPFGEQEVGEFVDPRRHSTWGVGRRQNPVGYGRDRGILMGVKRA